MKQGLCDSCGQDHEQPFSDALIDIFHRLREAKTEEDRASLFIELASQFAEDTSPTEIHLDEGVHEMLTDMAEANMAYHKAAMKLGRIIARSIEVYVCDEKERMKSLPRTVN